MKSTVHVNDVKVLPSHAKHSVACHYLLSAQY